MRRLKGPPLAGPPLCCVGERVCASIIWQDIPKSEVGKRVEGDGVGHGG